MQLRMLEDYNNAAYNSGNMLLAGEVYDVDEEHAAWLIANGKAIQFSTEGDTVDLTGDQLANPPAFEPEAGGDAETDEQLDAEATADDQAAADAEKVAAELKTDDPNEAAELADLAQHKRDQAATKRAAKKSHGKKA